ncbi:TetR/AcrR family transcriptional regulator [Streptomonospora halophila]|uniref:TetR/AcrR family transcriptional regulator n=2 Tax=Streptomonospora halophila TaxID=427369 RepID=A0ABP9G6E2_9ACTN
MGQRMTQNPPTRRTGRSSGGRRPDPAREAALRQAALELLAEVGYEALTVEAVAVRAGAGKATLYRRWASKADLVADAFHTMKAAGEPPDTGSLRGDLHETALAAAGAEDGMSLKVTIGVAGALDRHPDLRAAFHERFVLPLRARLRAVFDRAAARGEISARHDLDLLAEVFPALVLQRSLITGAPAPLDYMRHVIEAVVWPLACAPPPHTGPPSPDSAQRRTA